MKKILLITFVSVFAMQFSTAQPNLDWMKFFTGATGEFNDVVTTTDGGYIAVGTGWGSSKNMPSGYVDKGDALIAKITANRGIQWSDYWGKQEEDKALAVIQTADGGYAVAGYTAFLGSASLGGLDGLVVKYSATGTVEWEKVYGGSGDDIIYDIKQNADGSYIFVGSTKSPEVSGYHGGLDLWAVKTDNAGTVLWSKPKGYSGDEVARSVALTSNGGYIVSGYTNSPGAKGYHDGTDIWVMKLTGAGGISWQTCIGGAKSDTGDEVIVLGDGSIRVAGRTESNDGDISGNHSNDGSDLVMVHLDASGALIDTKVYGGTKDEGTGYTDNQCIRQTTDGGFAMLTSTSSNDGNVGGNYGGYDLWLIKISASGKLEWQKCVGSSVNDYARALDVTSTGAYIIATQYDGSWAGLITTRSTYTGITNLADGTSFNIYPNPTSDFLNISIDWKQPQSSTLFVYNIMGNACITQPLGETSQTQLDISALPAGSYYLKIATRKGQMVKAFQVVK